MKRAQFTQEQIIGILREQEAGMKARLTGINPAMTGRALFIWGNAG